MFEVLSKIPRNTALLVVLLVTLLVSPSIGGQADALIVELMFNGVLIAGVYSAGAGKNRRPFWLLTLVTLAYRWVRILSDEMGTIESGALALTLVWLVWAIAIIIGELFQSKDVTVDTIVGAVVAYLLVAVAFGVLYELMETERPGSFEGIPEDAAASSPKLVASMMYFSLICITTMGFGDIVPVSPLAKPVAALEGMFGQLYLAVMIARLVGLHLARDKEA